MLECQRCVQHFCIKCLNKSDEEYKFLQSSDSMWFFYGDCRKQVEKNIITDRKIEERCQAIMQAYEQRITSLEEKIELKVDEGKVKEIVRKELNQATNIGHLHGKEESTETKECEVNMECVLSEVNERIARENNIVICGIQEVQPNNSEERKKRDKELATDTLKACSITKENAIGKVVKKFEKTQENKKETESTRKRGGRPILVSLTSNELKSDLFKNIKFLHAVEEYKQVRIANDMTKTEREQEKKLREEAKRREEASSGEFKFMVRGPPWALKVVKVKKTRKQKTKR